MPYAEILGDSINSATGDRLTTFKIKLWKPLFAQLARHRTLSLSGTSSRAVPNLRFRRQAIEQPHVPVWWGANQRGMVAKKELPPLKRAIAEATWMNLRYPACGIHWFLGDFIGLHKELTNRWLELWLDLDIIISSTEWKNFYRLRVHPDTQPDFDVVATEMKMLHINSTPKILDPGEWHLVYLTEEDKSLPLETQLKVSAARCARTSYMRLGKLSGVEEDVDLCDRLLGDPPHASPFEHQAQALPISERCGNFVGWKQQRKNILGESGGDYERQAGQSSGSLQSRLN